MPTPRPDLDADRAHLIHPLHHPTTTAAPSVWVRGRGAVITDAEGRDYLDGLAGLWNVHVGHGREELAAAAHSQMSTLAYCSSYAGATNRPAIALAERLSELTYPSINTFFFTSGGAEATESSIKTARFYWKAQGKPDKVVVISRHRALPRSDAGRDERNRAAGVLADVRAARARLRPHRRSRSVPVR